tara:strand:- start:717 stop:860 length:144 start_codon:yes stop_codon:yes gene_type:complete
MAVLKALNLSKSYKKRPIIRDVSLSVESGKIVGLLVLMVLEKLPASI